MRPEARDLWRCPRCGAQFVTPNMWHSCGSFALEPLFARSAPHVFPLFQRLVELVQAAGPATIVPQKSRIVFMVRVRFLNVIPRKSHLLVSFGFARRHDSPRFHKVEQYSPRWYGHQTRVESEGAFDAEFVGWIREAYAVGQQEHLRASES
jgi:hypothetical protein